MPYPRRKPLRRSIDPGFAVSPGVNRDPGFTKRLGPARNIDPGFRQLGSFTPANAGTSAPANVRTSAPTRERTSAPKPVSTLAQAALPKNPGASVPRNREPVRGAYPGTYPPARPANLHPQPVKPRGTVPPGQVPAIADQQTQQQKLYDTYIQPLIDAITGASATRSQQGDAAIKAQTEALQAYQKGVDYGAPYASAQSMLQAAARTLGQDVSGVGSSLGSALGSKLAVINDPTVQAAADAVIQTGAQGASQIGSTGLNALAELIANQAGAKEYGLKQPGIAYLAGIQNVGSLESQISQDQAQQLTDLQSKVPGMINDLEQNHATAAYRAAQLAQGQQRIDQSAATAHSNELYRKAQLGLATKKEARQVWVDTQRIKQADQRESFSEWAKTQGLTLEGQRVMIAQQNADTSAARAARTPPGGKTKYQSKTVNGHTVTFDPSTGTYYIPGTTKTVNPNSLKKPPKPVSAAQLGKARTLLYQNAHGYTATATDTDTPLSPAEARAAQNAGEDLVHVVVNQHQDKEIQNLYLELVQKYGVPARQAFQMVAGQYKQWGQAHRAAYFPRQGKGGAVAEPTAYAPGQQLGKNELASLWVQAGGDPRAANTAAAVALAESSGRVDALNNNPATGDYSVSPWQINYYQGLYGPRSRQFGAPDQLQRDPLAAARAAVAISKNGRDFGPWTTYTSGKYKAYA